MITKKQKLTFLLALIFSQLIFANNTFNKEVFVQSLKANKNKAKEKWHKRMLLTLSCDDCEYIPKVPNAGKIFKTDGVSYQLMHNGVKILENCYYGSKNSTWMTNIIMGLRGHHEPQEEKVFYEILKSIPSDAIMLELGSYWAYYSMWFGKTIPNATNYLIEPCKSNLSIGKRNFELNNLTGKFFHGYAGRAKPNQFKGVKRFSIDTFLEEQNIPHLNILHSDIQGGELEMLKDCRQSIDLGKIDYFFVSTHSEKLHLDCLNFLKKNNLMIIAEHSPAESYSYDGLIVCKRSGVEGPDKIQVSKKP